MKITTKDRIDKLLNSAKLKKTEPRRMVLEVLLNATQPQTAERLFHLLVKQARTV